MKNSDKPAMPIEFNGFGQFAPEAHAGLTKREMFAMAAMQGMLSHPDVMHTNDDEEHENIAHAIAANSLLMADALLAEIERKK